MRKKNKRITINQITLTDYAAEGKALVRHEGKVIFVQGAVPGDTVDLLVTKNKKDWAEARVLKIHEFSKNRVEPFCQHFGVCGGCKWQMLPYESQLQYKQQEAEQNLKRIGGLTDETLFLPIVGAANTRHYRNKLEFTASNKRYLLPEEIQVTNEEADAEIGEPIINEGALGFHVPRIFDKAIDIFTCYLMDPINNLVRNKIRDFAKEHQMPFYDIRQHTGWLRNIMIRYTTTGELMLNVIINNEDESMRKLLLDYILEIVPDITSLYFTINPKWNDSIYDQEPILYSGKAYVVERLRNKVSEQDFDFMISPKSFFQTNTQQAEVLYSIAADFAGLTGEEIVYDLYCGTGSIGIFLSKQAKKIIGVELIEEAIEDAKKNAALNNVDQAVFFAGDVIKVCDAAFFKQHGKPDVIITDPPRAGMHEKLVNKILEMAAPKVVYVSCNTATQARDLALLKEKYHIVKVQPVDMFPHTHHIESVALLTLK